MRPTQPTNPEVPAPGCPRLSPGCGNIHLPARDADPTSVHQQLTEDERAWVDRVFTMFHHRLGRLEATVRRNGRAALLAAILPSVVYAAVALAYLFAGRVPVEIPVPPAKAAQP